MELRLRQLAKLEYERVEEEMKKLNAERETLEKILADEKTLKNVVAKETKEAAKLYGDARRTTIEEAKKASSEPVQVSDPSRSSSRRRATCVAAPVTDTMPS